MSPPRYVVAGRTPWTRRLFDQRLAPRPEVWAFVADPTELDAVLAEGAPEAVFFLHWSWTVPARTTGEHRCINFHMTDVPFGRGGSPLQNLVARGHTDTVITALEMTQELDAGPVLLRRPLSLHGTAEAVLVRAAETSVAMILEIVDSQPQPQPQRGEVVRFERRTPDQSRLPTEADLEAVTDHIRMLDADTYPHAHIDHGNLRIEFRRAARYDGRVVADATITIRESDQ